MIRRSVLVLALGSTLALAGCATTGGGDAAAVARIQEAATRICGFLPAAATVAGIIATFTGGGATVDLVSQAAAGICAAVTKKGARRGSAKYRGVVIRGEFVAR